MKHSFLLKTLLAVAILTTSYLPDAFAAFSFGEANNYQDVTMNASDVGQSFTANWFCSANTNCNNSHLTTLPSANLSATGTFTLDQYGSNYVKISAVIKNTTSSSFQAALMSIGLSTELSNPNLVPKWDIPGDSGTQGSIFKKVNAPGNFPGHFSGINACFYEGKSCGGTDINDGLGNGYSGTAPSTDSFTFFLTSNSGTIGSSLTLSDFAVKFQTSLPGGSFAFGDGLGPSPTPEPGSFWLLGSALLAMIGFSFRKTMPKKA